MRKIIAVIGDMRPNDDGSKERLAFELGKALVDNGYRVQSGGMGGVMASAFKGAKSSTRAGGSDTIAVLPSFDRASGNGYADIIIPTGLDIYRNAIVANADAVVAIGGGAGTLSEMAFSWTQKRLLIAYDNVEGWSKKIAGTRIDDKIRYENMPDDIVFGVQSADQVINLLSERLHLYTGTHKGILTVK